MKYIYNALLVLLCGVMFTSCDDDSYASAEYNYVGVQPSRLPSQIFEGTGPSVTVLDIPVRYGNNYIAGQDITVEIAVDPSSTAVLGTDFTLSGGQVSGNVISVTIPSDTVVTTFKLTTISNEVQGANKQIVFKISSATPGVTAGFPFSDTYTLDILDDDCPYGYNNFVGTADVSEDDGASFGYTTLSSSTGIPNEILIENFWGLDGQVKFVLVPCDNSVIVTKQVLKDSGGNFLYGDSGSSVEGSGTWDDNTNTLTLDVTILFPLFNFTSNEKHVYQF